MPYYYFKQMCLNKIKIIQKSYVRKNHLKNIRFSLKYIFYKEKNCFTQKQMRVKKHRDRYWIKSEIGGVSDDPKSESDNVTPKTTAIANDSGNCHNVTTNIEKGNVESNRTHRVVAGILGNDNVIHGSGCTNDRMYP